MKKIIIALLIFTFAFTNINAATLSNYIVYRIFDIPQEWDKSIKDIKFNIYNQTKRIGYTIKINSFYAWNMYLLWVDKDFVENKFRKNIESKNEWGISVVWSPLSKVNWEVGKIDRKTNIWTYNWDIEYQFLKDWPNYVVLCYQDFLLWWGKYTTLRCEKPNRVFYYIKEYNKVVWEEEFKKYNRERHQKFLENRKKELLKLNEYNKYFDENKVKKSRFWQNTRIKTHKQLQELILNDLKWKEINERKMNEIIEFVYSKYYTYDDNNKVLGGQTMRDYIRYTINEFIYQKKINWIEISDTDKSIQEILNPNQNTQNSQSTATENTNTTQTTQNTSSSSYNSNNQNLEVFKIKNADDRKRAIDFSKKLLKVLERYRNKETKLEKIQEIKVILDTKFTPDKYKNQNLIWYVKDYLNIVEYAIKLQ